MSVRCSVSEWCYESELRYIVKYLYSVFIATRCTVPTLLLHSSNFKVSTFLKEFVVCIHYMNRPPWSSGVCKTLKKKQSVKLLIGEVLCEMTQMKGTFFVQQEGEKKLQRRMAREKSATFVHSEK